MSDDGSWRISNPPVQKQTQRQLPCGHHSQGPPVSQTRTLYYYRCPSGCGLQSLKRHV